MQERGHQWLRESHVVLGANATLFDALSALEKSSQEIVLITDEAHRLLGVITDGDLRRAILRAENLQAPAQHAMNRNFVSVPTNASRHSVLDMMRARRISQIPIVDQGVLVGLHTLHELMAHQALPNVAVVMVGGKGTRLGSLTQNTPKPMLRVAGRPILEHILLHLVSEGIRTVYLAVNYLSEQVIEYFGEGERFGLSIRYLHEDEPRGTGGPLSLLPETPNAPILVMNGDLITQVDIARMFETHREQRASITVGIRRYAHRVPFGCIEIEGGQVKALTEKPTLMQWINAGIYCIEPDVLARVPKSGEYPITDLINDCLQRQQCVGSFVVDGDWIDVGQVDQLQKARGQ